MTVRTSLTKLLGALAIAWIAGASSAWAQDRNDVRIATEIGRQVDLYAQYSIFDHISGVVDDGVVTLVGKVTMPFKKDDVEKRVRKIAGVKDVRNQVEVLSVSSYDEELRRRIARAIYGNSAFWQYGARVNPPIHILVDRGHVTLVGVVNSHVERMLARSLATGFGELSVTNDLRTDQEMRSE